MDPFTRSDEQDSPEAIVLINEPAIEPLASVQSEKLGKEAGRQSIHVAVSDFLAGNNLLEKK